ncbi:transposase [Pontibacter sp. G13]|uniref:transposase n=1 Tax=Pontibacter sp. G13 TaxID=3074898 RepID=UPI00288C5A1C|nr:transposase [Pontibacter sp. G13]WNJ17578.1 transposase [Pontibacter sp. G13]
MNKSKFSDKEKLAILGKRDSGEATTEELCRQHQVSASTLSNWKKAFEQEANEEKRKMKQLEEENLRLKQKVADLLIDNDILQEGIALAKKLSARSNKKS